MSEQAHDLPVFTNNSQDVVHNSCCCGIAKRRCHSPCSPGILATVIGIVHGVAGPGSVLGVIPAVQLHNARLACVYLVTFCMTATVVMGVFAAFYGSLSGWLSGSGSNDMSEKGFSRVSMVEIESRRRRRQRRRFQDEDNATAARCKCDVIHTRPQQTIGRSSFLLPGER